MKNNKSTPEPWFKAGTPYGQGYRLPMDENLREAIAEHQQHHAPERPFDGKTLPYTLMDDKHYGRR